MLQETGSQSRTDSKVDIILLLGGVELVPDLNSERIEEIAF